MKPWFTAPTLVFTLLVSAVMPDGHAATNATPILKAGFAERDITPDIGMEQPGGYGKVFHKTFHDPCKVRAVVFDDGKHRVALVGIDALLIRRPSVEAIRKQIFEQCGIPPEAVLIGASHSHSSGPTGMVLPGEFDDAPPLVKSLAYDKSSAADANYLKRVEMEIVTAVCQANGLRVDAKIGVGRGYEDKVAFNRRLRMKNGPTFSHPGKGNPDIVGYAGPIDPEVGVIGVWDNAGKLLGCVVNFSCHATTNPGGISANWIHYLETTVQGALGTDAPVVYLQGACGDVTQVDNLSPYDNPTPEHWAQLVGGCVGAEVVKVLLRTVSGQSSDVPLAAQQTFLPIPRRAPSPEHVQKAFELVQQDIKTAGATEWTFAKETVMLDYVLKKQPVQNVEVQTIQVGPAVFVSNPAEYFVQYGLDIKKGSKFPFTFPVELANDCIGYVPTEEAFGPNGGGYETRLTCYSNLATNGGRLIANAGIEQANRLTPGPVPEPHKAPAFRLPWTYGNVPPEVK